SRQKCINHFQPLQSTGFPLSASGLNDLVEFFCFTLQVEVLQTALDRFGTHGTFKVFAVLVSHGAEDMLFALEIADFKVLETFPDVFHLVNFSLGAFAYLAHSL